MGPIPPRHGEVSVLLSQHTSEKHERRQQNNSGQEQDDEDVSKRFSEWREKLTVTSYFHIWAAVHILHTMRFVWGAALACGLALSSLHVCDLHHGRDSSKAESRCGSDTVRHGLALAFIVTAAIGVFLFFLGNYSMARAFDHVMRAQMLLTLANVIDTWQSTDDFWANLLYNVDTEIREQDPSLPRYIVWRNRNIFKVHTIATPP